MTFKKPPLHTFVINLESDTDRRKYICEHLDHYELPYTIISAVEGRKLSTEVLNQVYDSERSFEKQGRDMTLGEIGCTLSHARIWKKIVDENISNALILEDDAYLSQDTLEVMSRIDSFPKNWEITLLFSTIGRSQPFFRKPVFKDYRVELVRSLTWKTSSYLITLSGAVKLLKLTNPVYMPADWITGDPSINKAWVYRIKPNCADIHEYHSQNSSLEIERQNLQLALKEKEVNSQAELRVRKPSLYAKIRFKTKKFILFIMDSIFYFKNSI